MSKAECFNQNKLSSKSFSFELEQFFYLCLFQLFKGAALITSSIYDYCVIRRKEFPGKLE